MRANCPTSWNRGCREVLVGLQKRVNKGAEVARLDFKRCLLDVPTHTLSLLSHQGTPTPRDKGDGGARETHPTRDGGGCPHDDSCTGGRVWNGSRRGAAEHPYTCCLQRGCEQLAKSWRGDSCQVQCLPWDCGADTISAQPSGQVP